MSPEKTKALYDEFPELYREKNLGPSISLMCEGFVCGDGWFEIIHALSVVIKMHAKWNKCEGDKYPAAVQVKQKFGGLRFHYGSDIDAVDGAVDMAMQMSFRTCEYCGAPGRLHITNNWLRTLCTECAFNYNYTLCIKEDD